MPEFTVYPAYALMVLLGFALVLLFPVTRGLTASSEKKSYWLLQGISLFAALLGAKFAVLMGDALWPIKEFHDWLHLLTSGRSIVGALLFGFIAAEIAKPLLNYQLPPNDRFAMLLPFSIGIGRIGCYLAGCCRGEPWDGMFAITYEDNIPRHPAQIYDMLFNFIMGFIFIQLYRRKLLHGRLIALYMICYGVFRFISEFWRETIKAFGGFSAYQWMSVAMVIVGIIALVARSYRVPPAWGTIEESA
jgi:phosphatidylglycerol:prolipoprotein diacylglycerol transferase